MPWCVRAYGSIRRSPRSGIAGALCIYLFSFRRYGQFSKVVVIYLHSHQQCQRTEVASAFQVVISLSKISLEQVEIAFYWLKIIARLCLLSGLVHLAPHFTAGHLSAVSWAADALMDPGQLG